MNNRVRVIHGVTVSKSLGLMNGQIKFLNKKGFDCSVVSSNGPHISKFKSLEGCHVDIIDMEREIAPFKDIISLINLIKFFKKAKPTIVNAGTPKAGLLMTIAAKVAGVPIRIYSIRGLRLETTEGIKKMILRLSEQVACACATNIIAISPSLKKRVLDLNLTNESKITVLGKGSSNGINIEKYQKTEELLLEVNQLREKYKLREDDFVIGFIGRLTKDKGIDDLTIVFEKLYEMNKNFKLLIVGDFEEGDPVLKETREQINTHPNIIHVGFQHNVVPFYYLMNIFTFLTKREGFGNVSIEAALTGLPVITNNVTGAKDTVINNVTGYVLNEGSYQEIADKIMLLYKDERLRENMGSQGIKWVKENFSSQVIQSNINKYYLKLLGIREG